MYLLCALCQHVCLMWPPHGCECMCVQASGHPGEEADLRMRSIVSRRLCFQADAGAGGLVPFLSVLRSQTPS